MDISLEMTARIIKLYMATTKFPAEIEPTIYLQEIVTRPGVKYMDILSSTLKDMGIDDVIFESAGCRTLAQMLSYYNRDDGQPMSHSYNRCEH